MGTQRPGAGAAPPHRMLDDWVMEYRNERDANTAIYWDFDRLARQPGWLASHRDWVELNKWGFGDRALHHMWYLILDHLIKSEVQPSCLEIGVFKGQIISLWALIAARLNAPLRIAALSPFSGSASPVIKNRIVRKLLKTVSRKYREDAIAGNLYGAGDYLADCRRIFDEFGLDFDQVEILRGFSNDAKLLAGLSARAFGLIYVDGDHSEAGALGDVHNFAPKVVPGGFIVMDDAALSVESDLPYRGRPGASMAADLLPSLGFENILNVGHNRVFRKLPA